MGILKLGDKGLVKIFIEVPVIILHGLVGWGCIIHRLHFCKEVKPTSPTSILDMTLNNLIEMLQ